MIKRKQSFPIAAHIILIALSVCVLIPFILLISSSFTEEKTLIKYGYNLVPREIDFTAYKFLLWESSSILRGYIISFLVMGVGTVINLVLTILFACPLSRKELPGRKFFHFIFFYNAV